jgi:alpha-glucosidase
MTQIIASLFFLISLTTFAYEAPLNIAVELGQWHFEEHSGSFHLKEKKKKRCLRKKEEKKKNNLIFFKNCTITLKVTRSLHKQHYQIQNIPPKKQARIILTFKKAAQEVFYGAGTQYTHLTLNHRVTEFLTQEQGNGRGIQPLTFFQSIFTKGLSGSETSTYASAPILMTSSLRAFVATSYRYGYVDLTKDKTFDLVFHSDDLSLYQYQEKSWSRLHEKITEHTGRMRELPKWIQQGATLGIMGGKKKVIQTLKKLKQHGAAISAIWTQDWVGRRKTFLGPRLLWDWRLNTKEYPDMNFKDVASLGYFNPFVSPLPKGSRSPSFYDEALKKGFLVKQKGIVYASNQAGFNGHLVDLFNPQAYQWLKEKMKMAIKKNNFKGWMADFGEVLPFDAQTLSTPSKQHHQYVEKWIRLNREIVNELNPKELTFFNRASHLKVPGLSTLYWLGDQTSTWDKHDGLHSSLIGLITSGLSGMTLNHSDIGGYVSFCFWPFACFKRDQELLHRWMELNAFTALFRSHPGLKPSIAEQVYSSQESMKAFSYWSQVFKVLEPYKAPYIKLASTKGIPLIRAMFYSYQSDQNTHKIDDQFMLGDHLLIAPIIKAGTDKRSVYLPKGTWYRLWDDQKIVSKGQRFDLKGPRGKPPVYFKQGFPSSVKNSLQKL